MSETLTFGPFDHAFPEHIERLAIDRQFTVTYRPCNHEIVVWEGGADEKPVIVEQIPTVCPLCGPPQPAPSGGEA